MDNSIVEIYLLYPTAKAIWDAITVAYPDLEDSSQMFHLRNRCRLLHQGELSVTQYFNTLTKLWQELDLFNPKDWHDPKDATIYHNFLTRERTYDFLASLDRSLDDIHGRILNVKPLPLIDEIFAEVRSDESRKHVMLNLLSPSSEASALAARQSNSETNREIPSFVSTIRSHTTQRLPVGNFMESRLTGSLATFVALMGKVFTLSQKHLPNLPQPLLSRKLSWIISTSYFLARRHRWWHTVLPFLP